MGHGEIVRPRRRGILGGTFDPPHIAHLAVAVDVRAALALDSVALVVANDPWQKRGTRDITPAATRVALVRAAVAGHPGLVADDREVRRGGPSFTADTVDELRAEEPDAALFVVVGQDAAHGLSTWERADDLRREVTFVVVGRPGTRAHAPLPDGFRFVWVDVPALAVSSTEVRARARRHQPLDVLLPAGVASLVGDLGLYSGAR